MAEFEVITCADARYFHFLPHFERNVARQFGRPPLIYDLGLTNDQRASLANEVTQVEVPDHFKKMDSVSGFINATHKPTCIADSLRRNGGGCLYADADILFSAPITAADLGAADVAVTPRHPKERSPAHLTNGNLNSGLLFFTDRRASRALLTRWTEACAEGTKTDQKALSDLLAGFSLLDGFGLESRDELRLLKLDPRIFNDVRLRSGRVLHFKNAARDSRIAHKFQRYSRLEERHPFAFDSYFRLRRALGR